MKKNKFCINKTLLVLVLLVIVFFEAFSLVNKLNNTSLTTINKAAENNQRCGIGNPCPLNKYCEDFQGDSHSCVSDISYVVSIGTAAKGTFSDDTTYRYFGAGSAIYKYGQIPATAILAANKEYVINVQDPYPGEWWENVTDYKVTVTGVAATPIAVLDPKNYPKDWRSKTITFTSTGTGTIKINLTRTDPSNGRVLQRGWTIAVNVINGTVGKGS